MYFSILEVFLFMHSSAYMYISYLCEIVLPMPVVYRKGDKTFLRFNTKEARHNLLEMQPFNTKQEVTTDCHEAVLD